MSWEKLKGPSRLGYFNYIKNKNRNTRKENGNTSSGTNI